MRNPPHDRSTARQAQRKHAKQRLLERFELNLNRDQIHELERKITGGQSFGVNSKSGKTNHFVEFQGRLILVGYDPTTRRIATALPDEYLRKVPPEILVLARVRLLEAEQQRVLEDIVTGKGRLVRKSHPYQLFEVEHEGVCLHVGYDSVQKCLFPFPKWRGKGSIAVLARRSGDQRQR